MYVIHEQTLKMNKRAGQYEHQDSMMEAFQALTRQTGARVKILDREIKEENERIDARIQVRFRTGEQVFNVEAKGEVRAGILPQLLVKFGKNKERWLFVARYIPTPVKDQLRASGINYLEATGNCFVNTGQVYLFINDKSVKQARKAPEGKLWKSTGLKLLFALLQDKDLIDATYRELARTAGISLGSIQPILEELQQDGWQDHDADTGEWLGDYRERLIIRWSEIYPVVLQPRLNLGTFRFVHPLADWPRQLPEGAFWSGEPAGELYTHRLIPEQFILYTETSPQELVKELRIVPDAAGNIQLYEKFWQDRKEWGSVSGTVPPLLAYADLRSSADSRSWEIGDQIKHTFLHV